MKTNTKPRTARKALALPFGELPLFKWADARPPRYTDTLASSRAVNMLARRFGLPVALARAVAENAGYPVEAAHV
jgi:hypothetical protein